MHIRTPDPDPARVCIQTNTKILGTEVFIAGHSVTLARIIERLRTRVHGLTHKLIRFPPKNTQCVSGAAEIKFWPAYFYSIFCAIHIITK